MTPVALVTELRRVLSDNALYLSQEVDIPADCAYPEAFELGHRRAGDQIAVANLESALETYSFERDLARLRDNIVDEIWDNGKFTDKWGPIVSQSDLATELSDRWNQGLRHKLPFFLAYWLGNVLVETGLLESVASALAARTYERCCEEVEVPAQHLREVA